MKEYLSNEEVWLDPSDRIRNLDKGEVDVDMAAFVKRGHGFGVPRFHIGFRLS